MSNSQHGTPFDELLGQDLLPASADDALSSLDATQFDAGSERCSGTPVRSPSELPETIR